MSSAAPSSASQSGLLSQTPLPRLLVDLHLIRFEGHLELRAGRQTKKITFDKGFPVETQSNVASESLAQLLLESGRIGVEDRDRILAMVQQKSCRESVAVLSLEILDARQLLGVLKEQTKRRIVTTFGWPQGEFVVEAGETRSESVQALRCDPLPMVRDGMASHWPVDRILVDLMPRMSQFPSPRKRFVDLTERLADGDATRVCLARMDGTRTLAQALGSSASTPAIAASVWVIEAMSGLDFHREARDPDTAGAPRFDSEIEIQVASGGQEKSRATGGDRAAARNADDDDGRADALRAEIEKLYNSLGELDHYRLLGIKPDARGSAVKKAYFKAAKLYHPDTLAKLGLEALKDQAAEVFAQIAEAFEVLSDKQGRKDYDAVLRGELTDADATRLAQAETSYRKGEILLRMGDFAGALEYLQGAVDVWPEEGVYQSALGWAHYKKAKPDAAVARAHLTRAVDLTPDDAVAHFRLGTVLRSLGEKAESERMLTRARQLDPKVS